MSPHPLCPYFFAYGLPLLIRALQWARFPLGLALLGCLQHREWMPRPLLIRSDRFPYHVCARCNNREWFYLSLPEVWQLFCEMWKILSDEFSIQLHAFVLMSNHFHAVLTTPGADLDTAMLYLMREVAKNMNKKSGRINHVFGAPYKWSLISNRRYYEHAIKYVYQNPVKAGIIDRVEQYEFSTLPYLWNKRDLGFPLVDSLFERDAVMDLALWQKLDFLNTRYTEEEADCVRRALRLSVFKPKPHRLTGRLPLDLESTKVGRTN